MNNETYKKSLTKVNNNNICYKIKRFIDNIFKKNKSITYNDNESSTKENKKVDFIESIKNIENEQTKLLKLQKQYRSGLIKEKDLTQEQVDLLCNLYDKQIEELKKSNQYRKRKILEYNRKSQSDN